MHTKTLTNDAVFAALNTVAEIYKQPLERSLMQKVVEAKNKLKDKAQEVQEVRQRIEEQHGGDAPQEAINELAQVQTEVRLPEIDVGALPEDVKLTGPQLELLENLFTEAGSSEALPKGFPHVERLREAGVTTVAQLKKRGDLTEIDGIGDSYAEDIRAAL
jgi:uncharacterized protein YpuA (DUF1002 family)